MEGFPKQTAGPESKSNITASPERQIDPEQVESTPLRRAIDIALEGDETVPEQWRREKKETEEEALRRENDSSYANSKKESPKEEGRRESFDKLNELIRKPESEKTEADNEEIDRLLKFLSTKEENAGSEPTAEKVTDNTEETVEGASQADRWEVLRNVVRSKEIESSLNNARDAFARSEIALKREGLKGKRIEDIERAEEAAHAEHEYRMAMREERRNLAKALEGAEGKEGIAREALEKTTLLEAVSLYDAKTRILNEERKGNSMEGIVKRIQKIERWYRGLRPRNKILIAGALFATSGAGLAVGGAVGASMAGAALTGKMIQRILAGAGAGVALESVIKNSQMKKERRAMERAFGKKGAEEIANKLQHNNTQFDEAIFKIESKQGRQKARRYILAATGGGLLASGAVAGAFEYVGESTSGLVGSIKEYLGFGASVSGETLGTEGVDTPRSIEIESEVEPTPLSSSGIEARINVEPVSLDTPEISAEVNFESYPVEAGDTMYSVIKDNFPEVSALEGPAQNNVIENILTAIKEDPRSFGIESGDVNALSVGDHIDIDKINDILQSERIDGRSILERARGLVSEVGNESSVFDQASVELDSAGPDLSVDVPQEAIEQLSPAEATAELREFFRQTPGYLTHSEAYEHFAGMVERGEVDASALRSLEAGMLDNVSDLPADRYESALEIMKGGEDMYGTQAVSGAEGELVKAFERLWGASDAVADPSSAEFSLENPGLVEEVGPDISEVVDSSNETSVESRMVEAEPAADVHPNPEGSVLREVSSAGEIPTDPVERMNMFAPNRLFSLTDGGEQYEIRPNTLSGNTPYIYNSEGVAVGTLKLEEVDGFKLPRAHIFRPALLNNPDLRNVGIKIEKYAFENNIRLSP